MNAAFPLVFAALLFCIGIYGVLARRNAVIVLMSVEVMLAGVLVSLVAYSLIVADALFAGQVLALLVIAIGAAEAGIGLAIILLLFRNRASVNVDDADLLKH